MAVFVCTGNKGKLEEFRYAFQGKEKIIGLNDINISAHNKYIEPLENSDYFICNAAIKLFSALKFVMLCDVNEINKIIVDDSGLCVPELNYLPGVHSAHFAGHPKNDSKNNLLLKKKIDENLNAKIAADEKRLSAFFVCFLLSISIEDRNKFSFIKKVDFLEANNLLKQHELEEKLLKKVDLKTPGGSFHEKIQASLLCKNFPENIFINLSYGFCCGEVSTKEQNNIPAAGHGYDPLFYSISNPNLSFASIPLSEKNKISHRAFAMEKLNI